MSKRVILLHSSMTADLIQLQNQRRLEDLLIANKIDFVKIDGADPEMKAKRDSLFGSSNIRGQYPQCFFEDKEGNILFVGTWDIIEPLSECDSLPEEILKANPSIKTFKMVFREAILIE